MKTLHNFKPGKQTAIDGRVIEFSVANLQTCAANLNIHLHCFALDGVYRNSEGVPRFQEARAATVDPIQDHLAKIITRILCMLTRQGHLIEKEVTTYLTEADGIARSRRVRRCA